MYEEKLSSIELSNSKRLRANFKMFHVLLPRFYWKLLIFVVNLQNILSPYDPLVWMKGARSGL